MRCLRPLLLAATGQLINAARHGLPPGDWAQQAAETRLAFSTSAKLIWSTSRSTGTTRPLGVATATEMS